MNEPIGEDVVSANVQAVLELFGGELKEVRFPDVDARTLEAAVGQVRALAGEVARAGAALRAAEAAMAEANETLNRKAARALAYMRVYAEGDAALLERLESLAPLRVRRPRMEAVADAPGWAGSEPPRRRGRPAKNRATESLFDEGSESRAPSGVEAAAG